MVRRLAILLLALVVLEPLAAAERAYVGQLDAQGGKRIPLSLNAGDYLTGELPGAGLGLDLQDTEGAHLRRLVPSQGGRRSFMLVAPAGGTFRLQLSGAPAADYRLELQPVVPLTAQRAPKERLASPRLRALQDELARGGHSDAFWREMAVRGTPLVEALDAQQDRVTFLWRGARHNVRLFGGPGYEHAALQRLGDSDVWFKTFELPRQTRLSYQLAPDVPELDADAMTRRRAILATAQADPLNRGAFPERGPDAYQYDSVLELAEAPPQPWIAPRPGVARGSLQRHSFASMALGNTRSVYLYRPAGYRPGAEGNALLYLFDAEAYLGKVSTPTILDNLIAAGQIPPTAVVLIDNPSPQSRAAELPPNPDFAHFLGEELTPWLRRQGISAAAERTVIGGSSYGGLASAYAALRYPQVFGNVLSQSGSFWWAPPGGEAQWLTREYIAAPRLPLRFYLEAGQFEGGVGQSGIFETTRHLRDVLRAKGYPVIHREWASGHDYLNWRGTLADGLIALLGRPQG